MKTIKVLQLNTFVEMSRGLIGREHFEAVSFNTRWGIHTFFLNQTVTVLILDGNSIIQYIKVVRPNTIFLWNPRYSCVVEIVGERIEFKVGEKISIKSK